MVLTTLELDHTLRPRGGWPAWATAAPYRLDSHPQASGLPSLDAGANCQRYAYAVLELFDSHVAPHRSSELWEDTSLTHRAGGEAQNLDLALFNASADAWGAHVAIVFGAGLLHLCAEEGIPAIWSWRDFEVRPRYACLVGVVGAP